MQIITILALLATIAHAQPESSHCEHPEACRPEPCCFPDQWEARMESNDFIKLGLTVYSAFDQVNKISGTKTYDKDGKLVQHYITDYDKNITYSIQVSPEVTCTLVPSNVPYIRCLSDANVQELKYLGSAVLGPLSVGTKVNTWSFALNGYPSTVAVAELPDYKSPNTCAPVLQTLNSNASSVIAYLNVNTTVHDKDIFTIPESCKHQ